MKKSVKSKNRWKIVGVIILGIFLFSASMSVLFDFEPLREVEAEQVNLIKVKNGVFSYYDTSGYNFKFQCEINQILIVETEQYISENQFVMVSENSFGRTIFTFDYLYDGRVKFTIDHKGNMIRDNWFRITTKDIGFNHLVEKSILTWETGYFDYSDMKDLDNFRIEKPNNEKYWLSVEFKDSKNFWIDPILAPEISLTNPVISESANDIDQFTPAYQPIFVDSFTEDSLGNYTKTEYYECTEFEQNRGDFWTHRMKNETTGTYHSDTENLTSAHFIYHGHLGGERFLSNHEFNTAFDGFVEVGNFSVRQWFSIPFLNKLEFTDGDLYLNLTAPNMNPDWVVDSLDSNDALIVELVNHTIGSETGFSYPSYGWNDPSQTMSTTVSSGDWQTQSEEIWNLPVISDVRAEYNFTGTEIEYDELQIDITDLLQYWSENFGDDYNVFGLRFRLTNWNDETNPSAIFIGKFKFEYDYVNPRIFGNQLPYYWNQQGNIIVDEMTMIDQHLEMQNTKVFPIGKDYLGGRNWQGSFNRYIVTGTPTSNLTGEYTTDGIRFNYTKTSATTTDHGFNMGFQTIASDGANKMGSGEYTIRFRVEDNYDPSADATFQMQLYSPQQMYYNLKANGIGSGSPSHTPAYSDVFDGNWHTYTFRYTDSGGFIEPHNHLFGYEIIFDDEVIKGVYADSSSSGSCWFNDFANSMQFGIGFLLWDDGDDADAGDYLSIEIDYISTQPLLNYRLSTDVTTGDYSLEAFSYSSYYARENTTEIVRTWSDYISDGSTDHIALYSFDFGFGTKLYDKIGNHHGVITGADWVDDSPDLDLYPTTDLHYSLDFESDDNDFVNITDSDDFSFTDGDDLPFSISAWVNIESLTSSHKIISKLGFQTQCEWEFFMMATGKVRVLLSNSDMTTGYIYADTVDTLSTGQWYHLVMSYNGNETNKGISIYVNGTKQSLTYGSYSSYVGMSNTDCSVTIGNSWGQGAGIDFDGKIDQIRIIDYNLTDSEVAQLYREPDSYGHSSVGFSGYDSDDITVPYQYADDGNLTQGEELLRLSFGSYYRRLDELSNGREDWYNYASEGLSLINHPILTFDMKVNFWSNSDNDTIFGQINDMLSNGYITIYNESMYPMYYSSWYDSYYLESGNDYGIIQNDLGFTVVEDQWVSIRVDLRNVYDRSLESFFTAGSGYWRDNYYTNILESVGGIGFSFYFQQQNATRESLSRLWNNTNIGYSVKIDNMQFLPISTVGFYPDSTIDMTEEGNYWYFMNGNSYFTSELNSEYVKSGNNSWRLYNYTSTPYDSGADHIGYEVYLGEYHDYYNYLNGSYDYFGFWVYPIDCLVGFRQQEAYYYRDFCLTNPSSYNFYPSTIQMYGDTDTRSIALGNGDKGIYRHFLIPNQWTLMMYPLDCLISFSTGGAHYEGQTISGILDIFQFSLNWAGSLNMIVDGVSLFSGNFDYTNLTIRAEDSGWSTDYTINSTNNNLKESGWSDSWEFFESYHDPFDEYGLESVVDPSDPYIGTWDEHSYFPEAQYVSEIDGFEASTGHPIDFTNDSDTNWYWNDQTVNSSMGDWTFGSNVNVSITGDNTLYLDVLNEGSISNIEDVTWFACDMGNNQIDWLYWNTLVIKVKSYISGTYVQKFHYGIDHGYTEYYMGNEEQGFVNLRLPIVVSYYEDNPTLTFFLDNTTLWLSWTGDSSESYVYDIEIESIKLYRVEGGNLDSYGDWTTGNSGYFQYYSSVPYIAGNYQFESNSSNVMIGNNSLSYNIALDINDPYDDGSCIEWSAMYNRDTWKYVSTSYNYYSFSYGEINNFDWSNASTIEFWLKANESLSGGGDSDYGQAWFRMGGVFADDLESTWQVHFYNFTHWTCENTSYDGTLYADTWYKFVIPLDQYNFSMGGYTPDLSQVAWWRIEIEDGFNAYLDLGMFTSTDGNYTLYLDGLRPSNFTFSAMGDSTNYVSQVNQVNYQSTFGYSSTTDVLTKHELEYSLSRNPSVSSYVGYLNNGSNQVVYELNYTIGSKVSDYSKFDYSHTFCIPKSYSFYNVTFGNGTVKTIESGFSISSYNDSHYLITVIAWEAGDWEWNFITENACAYLEISPELSDGLQYNVTSISYNVQLKNGSDFLIGYPVLIEVKHSDDTILTSDTKVSGVEGWVNSSITGEFVMKTSDKRLYLSVTCTNQSYLGYITDYFLSYQDFSEPVINQIDYDNSIIEGEPFNLYLYVEDDYTDCADLTVYFYYSEISSGSLDDYYIMEYVSGTKWQIYIAGKEAETTLWFKIKIWDNLTNLVESSIYSTDWIVAPAGDDDAGDSGDSGGTPASPSVSTSSGDSTIFILLFLAGGAMVAVLGYAVFKRVTVRTRKVETREVVTGFGGFGRTTEIKEEKGG